MSASQMCSAKFAFCVVVIILTSAVRVPAAILVDDFSDSIPFTERDQITSSNIISQFFSSQTYRKITHSGGGTTEISAGLLDVRGERTTIGYNANAPDYLQSGSTLCIEFADPTPTPLLFFFAAGGAMLDLSDPRIYDPYDPLWEGERDPFQYPLLAPSGSTVVDLPLVKTEHFFNGTRFEIGIYTFQIPEYVHLTIDRIIYKPPATIPEPNRAVVSLVGITSSLFIRRRPNRPQGTSSH